VILLREEPFRVAEARFHSGGGSDAQGLVVRVFVRFGKWAERAELQAEAFIDPGADVTTFRRSWFGRFTAVASQPTPWVSGDPADKRGRAVSEPFEFRFGTGPWLEGPVSTIERADDRDFPGHEDILIGRDFLTQNGLLLVIDGATKTYSLLHPGDDANRGTRERIRQAITDDAQQ